VPARVFVAIELPRETRQVISGAVETFLTLEPSWRGEKAVAPDLLHVTLAFLGTVPEASLAPLLERLPGALGPIAPFDLTLSGARAVPSRGHASMLWATLSGAEDDAAMLASSIRREAGVPLDGRPFRAHVTLARSRRPRPIRAGAVEACSLILSAAGKAPDRTVSVHSATVFSSTLGAAGPTYDRLAVLMLGTAGHSTTAR